MHPKNIILLNGPPGCGKDRLAEELVASSSQWEHRSFKQELIEVTSAFYKVTPRWFLSMYTHEGKDLPCIELDMLSRRQALQHVAENIMKPTYGKGYFAERMMATVSFEYPDENLVISDLGFPEELREVRDRCPNSNVIVVQIERKGCTFLGDTRKYVMSSARTVNLSNDFRTVEEWQAAGRNFIEWVINHPQ